MADNVALQHKHLVAQCQTFASATTGAGVTIDARGYQFATFFIGLGTTVGADMTVDVKTQSDADSGMGSPTDITNGAATQITSGGAADNTLRVIVIDLKRVSERYIRSFVTTANTVTSCPIYVHCVLSNGPIQTLKADYSDYDANFS